MIYAHLHFAGTLSERDERPIEENTLISTLSHLSKTYYLSFDVEATEFGSGYQSIIHLTIGGDKAQYGDRTPAVWYNSGKKLYICSAVSGNRDNCYTHPNQAQLNTYTNVQISQRLENGKYMYRIYIDGERTHEVENTQPKDFTDVKVYVSVI